MLHLNLPYGALTLPSYYVKGKCIYWKQISREHEV